MERAMTKSKKQKKTNSALPAAKVTKPQETELTTEQLDKVDGGIIAILIGKQ
jgi:hypothetical protein